MFCTYSAFGTAKKTPPSMKPAQLLTVRAPSEKPKSGFYIFAVCLVSCLQVALDFVCFRSKSDAHAGVDSSRSTCRDPPDFAAS